MTSIVTSYLESKVIIAVAVCNKTTSGGEIAPHITTHGEVTE
jgi:hypothetical protein